MRNSKPWLYLSIISLLCAERAWANCGLPGPNQVIIYQDINRGGACAVLELGDYPNASTFGLPNDSISSIDVGTDVRAVLYEHANFRGRQAHFEGSFYWSPIGNVNDRTSSIEVFPRQGGPAATDYLGNFPRDRESFWAEGAQGLANDGANWFITITGRLFKVPLSFRLDSSGLITAILTQLPCQPINPNLPCSTTIPTSLRNVGYNHFGDLDQDSGFLFVPLEQDNRRSKPRIAVFSTVDLRFLSSFEVSDNPNREAPWLAIRREERTLWLSTSELGEGNQLREYDIDWHRLGGTADAQLVLTFRRQVTLQDRDGATMNLTSIQGGVFNPEGTLLYLSSGPCDAPGYVYVFAIEDATNTARLQARSENRYGPFNFETHPDTTFGRCSGDEGEGLDWLDVRGLNVPGVPDGQLHLIMLDNDAGTDNVFLKHYSY